MRWRRSRRSRRRRTQGKRKATMRRRQRRRSLMSLPLPEARHVKEDQEKIIRLSAL